MLDLVIMAILSSLATYLFIKRKEGKELAGFKLPELGIQLRHTDGSHVVMEEWQKLDPRELQALHRAVAEVIIDYYIDRGVALPPEKEEIDESQD